MKERKMIEIHQEITSYLKDEATRQLLKREAPALLKYMSLWRRDLGDLILATKKISLLKRILDGVLKVFGFGDKDPRDVVLALVTRSRAFGSHKDAHGKARHIQRIQKFKMHGVR